MKKATVTKTVVEEPVVAPTEDVPVTTKPVEKNNSAIWTALGVIIGIGALASIIIFLLGKKKKKENEKIREKITIEK